MSESFLKYKIIKCHVPSLIKKNDTVTLQCFQQTIVTLNRRGIELKLLILGGAGMMGSFSLDKLIADDYLDEILTYEIK